MVHGIAIHIKSGTPSHLRFDILGHVFVDTVGGGPFNQAATRCCCPRDNSSA